MSAIPVWLPHIPGVAKGEEDGVLELPVARGWAGRRDVDRREGGGQVLRTGSWVTCRLLRQNVYEKFFSLLVFTFSRGDSGGAAALACCGDTDFTGCSLTQLLLPSRMFVLTWKRVHLNLKLDTLHCDLHLQLYTSLTLMLLPAGLSTGLAELGAT